MTVSLRVSTFSLGMSPMSRSLPKGFSSSRSISSRVCCFSLSTSEASKTISLSLNRRRSSLGRLPICFGRRVSSQPLALSSCRMGKSFNRPVSSVENRVLSSLSTVILSKNFFISGSLGHKASRSIGCSLTDKSSE
ncbi:hypothetical protein D3C80_1821760 [compost metagenome]